MKKLPVRLAMRHEGDFWCAYLAHAESMDGAQLIGSIAIGAVRRDEAFKERFLSLMSDVLALLISDIAGETPLMSISDAPVREEKRL